MPEVHHIVARRGAGIVRQAAYSLLHRLLRRDSVDLRRTAVPHFNANLVAREVASVPEIKDVGTTADEYHEDCHQQRQRNHPEERRSSRGGGGLWSPRPTVAYSRGRNGL